MPGTNLSRREARARSALLRVQDYRVDLDLTRGDAVFGSTTEIDFTAAQSETETFIDLVAPSVHEVILNGAPLDPATAYRDGRIHLTGLQDHNTVKIVADCAYSNTGQGLHRTVDAVDGKVYLYTHFEVPDARRVYATFEQPDLKGRWRFTVTAPKHWTVLSNSPTPIPEQLDDNRAVWRFAPTEPISSYVTALIAGEYYYVTESFTTSDGQEIPLGVGCRQSLAPYLDAAEILVITKQGFEFFVKEFGRPYPFEKYDQMFVPEYNIGAMENVGCVTIVESYIFKSKATDTRHEGRATTILHEMAHMWFGDLVTMQWWDDLWLKESFATYMGTLAVVETSRWRNGWTTFAYDDKGWALEQDQLPSTHPIVAEIRDLEDVGINFDGITYAKGAAVLKQLVVWVGRDAFFAGVRDYFDQHAWRNTTLRDLLDCLEKSSGRNLTEWAAKWLETAGPNTLRPVFTLDEDGRYASFAVQQTAPVEHPTLRPHRIAIGCYNRTAAGLERAHRVEVDIDGADTEIGELVGAQQPDLLLLNDDDLSYAQVRFDERSIATLVTGIGDIADALARTVCWTAAWDMVRAGELAARDYIRMVLAGADSETEIGVLESMHRNVIGAVEQFVSASEADATAALLAEAAADRLRTVEAGSDEQLAWARLLAKVARTPATLQLVTGLVGGSIVVDGLVMDSDLRWALLATLARNGRADKADIDAELALDPTTVGQQYAAGAEAAIPTAEAKARAWASVMDRDDLPNAVQRQVVGGRYSRMGLGFQQANQAELLGDYAPRYFAVVGQIWASRPLEIARTLVSGLYPRTVVDQATVDATDAYLADPEVPPALRRLLVEARDDIERALKARSVDAAPHTLSAWRT